MFTSTCADIATCLSFILATLLFFLCFTFMKIFICFWSLYLAEVLNHAFFFQCPEGTKKHHWTSSPMPLPPLLMSQYPNSAQPGAISPCSRDAVENPVPFPAVHELLFGPSLLTWNLAFHLAIASLLRCHHPHLCLPCLGAEAWHPIAAATGVTGMVPVLVVLLAPGSPVSAEQPSSCNPCLWDPTHLQSWLPAQLHPNHSSAERLLSMSGGSIYWLCCWCPAWCQKVQLPLQISPRGQENSETIVPLFVRCIPLLPVWRSGVLNPHKGEQWPMKILHRLRISVFKMCCTWN